MEGRGDGTSGRMTCKQGECGTERTKSGRSGAERDLEVEETCLLYSYILLLSFSFQITNLFTKTVVSSRLESVIGPAGGRAHRVAQQ